MSKVPHSFLNISNAVRLCFLIQTITKPFTDDLSFQPKTHPRRNVKVPVRVRDTELRLPPIGSNLLMFFGIISRLEAFQHHLDTKQIPHIFVVCFFFESLAKRKTHHASLTNLRYLRLGFFKIRAVFVVRLWCFFSEEEHRAGIPKCYRLSGWHKKKGGFKDGVLPGFFHQISNGSFFFFSVK